MKKIKYLFLILTAIALSGYLYWNHHKKAIIKKKIQEAVNKSTDSLYFVHYDSSAIDEINGNASFFNITLQSDSAQKALLKNTEDLPNALINIKVGELSANGIDIPGLLKNKDVSADRVIIVNPFVHIINTGKEKPRPYSAADTMELYKKILGRFKTIKANHISIKNGTILITNIAGKSLTTFENINIDLQNLLIDSTRNYENIISYFINDVRVTVENIQLPETDNHTRINLEKLRYDAHGKILAIGAIQQYKTSNLHPVIDLKNILLTGLNTNSFIRNQLVKADSLSCDGGLITISLKEKTDTKGPVRFSSELIDELQVGTIKLDKTKIIVVNANKPAAAPFILNDVRFTVSKILKITQGSLLNDLVNNSEWQIQSSGFSFFTKNKLYKLTATGINIDNKTSMANINSVAVTPMLSVAEYMKRNIQGDRYDLQVKNIQLKQIDIQKILTENKIVIQEVYISPDLVIDKNHNPPVIVQSKVGKYPHQSLQRMKIPIFLKSVHIKNGSVSYLERGKLSGQTGAVEFKNLEARIDNLTNITEKLKNNSICTVNANTLFLGIAKLHTIWKLPLTKANSTFTISGELEGMPGNSLNPIVEPLAMASVKSGEINNLQFNYTGNDYASEGEVLFLYNDLRLELLKKNEANELTGKDASSFIANLLIKNNNPSNGHTRKGIIDFKRDPNKSFFNLLWKSIFDGVKKTVSVK